MWIFVFDAIWGYEELFYTAFGSLRGIGEIFRAMGPLVLIGLGFAVASRAGFFNVGLPGQALAGWILSGWFALSHPDMPRPLMILATIVIALIAGGIVGAIPGILRAYLGTSEVIVTIMMNYIVLYVGNAFIHAFPKDFMQSTDSTIRVGANATYQTPWLSELTGNSRMNIGIFFGLTGRIIPTSSACSSGSQGIGYAYESIKHGLIPMMLAGGAEEFCPSEVYVFDSLYAASRNNANPSQTPRPYDKDRDGLVIGEGAGIFVLEELEHALARGAKIIAEIVGYGANSDGAHVTRPQKDTMQRCMELALKDAELSPNQIGYVDGHGTATEQGDIAETQATEAVFGHVPLSSQKSYLGHTLGACGALESWFAIEMMRDGWFAPTLNLDNIDERCGKLDYICGDGRHIQTQYVMNNNFAFGGVNTSLIFKRWED